MGPNNDWWRWPWTWVGPGSGSTEPERARQLVDEAHEEAKAALAELRNLARGITRRC